MFDYSKMIKRAIEFFPRWTDIRKRYRDSNGGNLLSTVLDESIRIEEAIQEYIDSYFLETYEGHEDEVMAFSYMATIGQIDDLDNLKAEYNGIKLMVTSNARTFNEDNYDNYVYYEEGRMFIKESLYKENINLKLTIDNSETEYALTKYHVWNIFDEFATFVNTRRYENETNKQLLDRILYITRNLPNGTEDGLKHAIISELLHFDENIKLEDIKIERATPENLIKPYEEFESLLEKLMYINRDVFKCKRWDFDYWQYDFESISYIPHKWNETLSYWQNGIGHGDDLKVLISDSEKVTDVKLTLYNKSPMAFEKYVQNKDVDYNMEFKLVKYNNVLNKSNIKYKLKASEIADITHEEINLHLYEAKEVKEERNAEELYSFGKGIEIIDNSIIPVGDINWYKIKFVQKDKEDFKISKAEVIYTNENTGRVEDSKNLLAPCTGFIYNAEKELVSSYNQKVINRVEDLNINYGLTNIVDGMTIEENGNTGSAVISINNYAGMYMTVSSSCDMVDVPRGVIKSRGTYWTDDNEFVIRGDYSTEEKEVVIELEANEFQFEVLSTKITGRSSVILVDDGVEKEPVILNTDRSNNRNIFAIEPSKLPRKIKVTISTLSFNDVVLGNFKYSNYSLQIDTDFGELTLLDNNKCILPNIKNNNLNIRLASTSGKKPVIHRITIGDSLDGVVYITDYIDSKSFTSRKFNIKTTADMYLLKIKALDNEMIRDAVYNAHVDLYNLMYDYFRDDIEAFFKTNNIILGDKIQAILDILGDVASLLYDTIGMTNILSPYLNKLFNYNNNLDNLIKLITYGMDSFIQQMKDEKIIKINSTIPNYSLADIFPMLNKPYEEIEILDKIEWHRIAHSLADKISSYIVNLSMEDVGKFEPRTIYKGKITSASSESFIRLDLSEYEIITEITSNGGIPVPIEESGVVYYNIKLNDGAQVSTVTITGLRNKEAREVPLIDMIKYQVPDFDTTYDKILCSRLSDSVIVSRTNPGGTPYNILVKLSSDMIKGIKVTKYELELPSYIGNRYGIYTLASNDNPVTYQAFDYISFYPAGGIVYEAINEYSSYLLENRDIPIVNSFAPALNMSNNMYYTVENINSDEASKYIIRFHNENNKDDDIYSLDSWCIGQHSIAIYNNVDLFNDVSYSVNTYDVRSREKLSSVIDIKDTYTLNNNMILDTTQFIVKPQKGVTIKYEEYNGSKDKEYLLKFEEVIIDTNKFNKLTYSNIDGIFHLSKTRYDNSYIKDDIEYTLLPEQGIIVWNDKIEIDTKIYLVYAIKKPIGFLIDIDTLYKAINYNVEAYSRINTILLSNIKDDEDYPFSKIDRINEVDLIHIDCSNPTFEGIVLNDERVVRFNKFIDKPTILIRSGYYYINGREYFLFSEDEDEQIINNKYYGSENIDISGGEITTFKPTNNFLNNTEMRLRGTASIFDYDCKKQPVYGVSKLNSLTACSSFNDWDFFAMKPELVDGVNNLALKFTPSLACSYAYLEITNALVDNELNYISLLATSDLRISIATEEKYLGIDFNRSLNMKIVEEIPYEGSETRMAALTKEPNMRYYLVVQNQGILDDIIITTDKFDALNGHIKNIDLLGLDLLETKIQGSEYRISIDDNKDYTPYEAGLMSDGYIKTTSKLDWYITQVAKFDTEADFFDCTLNHIDVKQSYIATSKTEGRILTPPIYINNQSTIKKLIFKINDIELDQMTGFGITVYTSNTYNNNYIPVGKYINNKGYIDGNSLMQYVKFKIEMPSNKILNNLFVYAEYKSSAENVLKLPLHESGYIVSKIYDLQETLDYRLKDLGIDDVSNINDIEIYVRASRDVDKLEIWHSWQQIQLNKDLSLKEYLIFNDIRYMQVKILLKTRQTYIKFNHLDVEVI